MNTTYELHYIYHDNMEGVYKRKDFEVTLDILKMLIKNEKIKKADIIDINTQDNIGYWSIDNPHIIYTTARIITI